MRFYVGVLFLILLTSVGCSLDAELLRLSSNLNPVLPGTPGVVVLEPGISSINVRSNYPDTTAEALQIFLDQDGHLLFNSGLNNNFVKKITSSGATVNFPSGQSQYESHFQTKMTAFDSVRQRFIQVGYTYSGLLNESHISVEVLTPDGERDPTFNSGNVTAYLTPPPESGIEWAGIDSSGAIYVAGYIRDPDTKVFVIKYLPNGSLDTSYGVNGFVLLDINPGFHAWVQSCDFTSTDKLVCVGYTNQNYFLVMLNASGNFDSSFSTDGIILDVFEGQLNDRLELVAIDKSNDRIYALGIDSQHAKMIALSAAGIRDTTFAGTGILSLNGVISYRDLLKVTSNGDIFALGSRVSGGDMQLTVAKILSDGTLDGTFGSGGSSVFPSLKRAHTGLYKMITGAYIDNSENLYLFGNALDSVNRLSMYITKVLSNGSVDTSFATNGVLRPQVLISSAEEVKKTIRDGNENFIFGHMFNNKAVFLSKHVGTSVHSSFAVGGHFSYYLEAFENIETSTMVRSKDGGFYIALDIYDSNLSETSHRILKVTSGGVLDSSFSSDGIVILPRTEVMSPVQLVVDDDNSVYSFSMMWDGANQDEMLIHKTLSTGSLDSSFGTAGELFVAQTFWPLDGAFQNGKIILAGNAYISGDDFAVLRLLPTGAIDTTFGTAGITAFPLASENSFATIDLDADGNITALAGTDYKEESFIAKMDKDGSPNVSWGSSGMLQFTAASSETVIYAMETDSQGRIWLSGYDSGVSLLVRLNPSGAIDTTFGVNGYLKDVDFFRFSSVSIEADGLVTVTGEGRPDGLNVDAVVVRYDQDGNR